MGLFRGLIVIAVGLFVLSLIEDEKSIINKHPVVKKFLKNKLNDKKCLIVIFAIALIDFIL